MSDELEVCLFTCTGTEANELAMRIARTVTGNHGAIVLTNSYHGNSNLIVEMSTFALPEDRRPNYIAAIEPPDTYRGPFRAFVVANFASQPDADDVDMVIDQFLAFDSIALALRSA